jgi:hypothetical protein
MIIMKDLTAKDVVVKEEKESSESENENESLGSDNEQNAIAIEPTKAVVYDDVKMKLMKKYSEIVSKKNNFGGTQGSWYTLKFYIMKETSAAKYYLVEMEFSNDDKDPMKELNIWLKATFIHDVLKCLSTDDKDAKSLFNGFEKAIADGELAEVCLEPNGANTCRSNTNNRYNYKQYVNYYLIPKEMGSFKHIIEKFKDTMIKLLGSDEFFSMMVVYQNGRINQGGKPGEILKNPNSSIWTQLKAPKNNKIEYLNALDAKFMDHDINIILTRMFGNKNAEAKYQKYGWVKTECKLGKSKTM